MELVKTKTSLPQQGMDFIVKHIRSLFMQVKYFYGSYADNIKEAHKYIDGSDRVVLHYTSSLLKFHYEKPEGDEAFISKMIDEQMRSHRRDFRKEQKAILFYYHDNFITRMLGFKKGMAHHRFMGTAPSRQEVRKAIRSIK